MSNIDAFASSPYRQPLSTGGRRQLDVMQERANELRRLADDAPDRRANLLGVAQRLKGLAQQADFAAFGRLARLKPHAGPERAPQAEARPGNGPTNDARGPERPAQARGFGAALGGSLLGGSLLGDSLQGGALGRSLDIDA